MMLTIMMNISVDQLTGLDQSNESIELIESIVSTPTHPHKRAPPKKVVVAAATSTFCWRGLFYMGRDLEPKITIIALIVFSLDKYTLP